MPIAKYIHDIQGFPKKGILFKDIIPLLIDSEAKKK
jgi:adenine phosphoribosyltransferase